MQDNFVSAGNMRTSDNKATITFMKKNKTTNEKAEYLKVNAEDYKPPQTQRVKSQQTGFGPPADQIQTAPAPVTPPPIQFQLAPSPSMNFHNVASTTQDVPVVLPPNLTSPLQPQASIQVTVNMPHQVSSGTGTRISNYINLNLNATPASERSVPPV